MSRLRLVEAAEAVSGVQSGERVFLGSAAADPVTLVAALTGRASELRDVSIIHSLTFGAAPYVEPRYARSFRHTAFFIGANVRQAVRDGRADFVPIFLSEIPALFTHRLPIDWAFVQLSPPDRHGYCSVGVSAETVVGAIRAARHVVAEINPRMPRTLGDTMVHIDDVSCAVAVDHELPELVPLPPTEIGTAIGRLVGPLIADGDCLQIGIGAMPNAVLQELRSHRHLGVHTELLVDGVVDLVECGAIDGSRKNYNPGKIIATVIAGRKRLYDFVDDNLAVECHGCDVTNDPFLIARNDNMVSVNAALQIDLTGQVDADSFGTELYSGIGGQVDYMRGAARSRSGRPILTLPSTAEHDTISRIVPTLPPGAGVVTSRGDVHLVVTEYGVADLYAKGVHERARALIGLAHPKFRDELERKARELGLIGPAHFASAG
jgi:4-hydroxybutyrate CoA-transferase